MSRIRMLCIIPDVVDATSFYRAVGPLSRIRQLTNGDVSFINKSSITYADLLDCDLVFIQRPFVKGHAEIAEMTKIMNKPLWIDYDDDLLAVPTDNPTHSLYATEETANNVTKSLSLADCVTVSTDHLKKMYSQGSKNIRVINNALDFELLDKKIAYKGSKNIVMWRGSATHHRDVMSVTQNMVNIYNKWENFQFQFVGDRLWFLTDNIMSERTKIYPAMDPILYFNHIFHQAPKVLVVPLANNVFNHSKSNIAYLEGIYAGACVIAPDMPEFRQIGCANYKTADEFEIILDQACAIDEEYRKTILFDAQHHILKNFNLEEKNIDRLEIIQELSGKKINY